MKQRILDYDNFYYWNGDDHYDKISAFDVVNLLTELGHITVHAYDDDTNSVYFE